ncbi:hypothetical protein BB561_005148 [Smittium simulii]|uniref:Major facilitator superfamily (MFS) profile domain-containing protein n=1 Tax=Smittium simulii TaxID=133385 RepID=A0A2T9YBW8_9FUNG|nr:hypothetical protein BB561_005148 [Smittium simulii]
MTASDIEKSDNFSKDLDDLKLNVQESLTPDQEVLVKSYLRKIDMRILPIVILLYIFSLIDRGNIGAALVSGLGKELKLSKSNEGDTVTYFYVFYLLCEAPSNILLKKTKPHIWFALIGSLWSLACIGLAFAKNGTTFIVLRAALGAFESGLTPGIMGYLNYWYTRTEVGFRMTIFFVAVPISGMIGGPLSAALSSRNLGPFKPYQAIFFVEGLLTLIISLSSFFILIDYPDQAKFLKPEEKELLIKRLNNEQGMASQAKPTVSQTLKVASDWKIYLNALIFFGLNNFAIILGTFTPTMLNTNGFNRTASIYLSALPNLLGLFGVLLSMRLVNKVSYSTLIMCYSAWAIICYSVAAFVGGSTIKLVFLSLCGFGAATNIPLSLSWSSVNQGGIYKGLLASAIVVSIGSICGVVIPRFFVIGYGPNFVLGHSITIACVVMALLLVATLKIYYSTENKRRTNNPVDLNNIPIEEQRLLNDRHPNFRYQI